MNEEYPEADYCYCPRCVGDFKAATGIDILAMDDPSTCQEWKQFRYDVVTRLVARIAEAVHAKGKKVSAAVFPGPEAYALKLVRQEWNKWPIDAFFPMNYNDFYLEPASWVGKVTKDEVDLGAGTRTGVQWPVYLSRTGTQGGTEGPRGPGTPALGNGGGGAGLDRGGRGRHLAVHTLSHD